MLLEGFLISAGIVSLAADAGVVMGYITTTAFDGEYTLKKVVYWVVPSILVGGLAAYNILEKVKPCLN